MVTGIGLMSCAAEETKGTIKDNPPVTAAKARVVRRRMEKTSVEVNTLLQTVSLRGSPVNQ
jgi:hypothetical protein